MELFQQVLQSSEKTCLEIHFLLALVNDLVGNTPMVFEKLADGGQEWLQCCPLQSGLYSLSDRPAEGQMREENRKIAKGDIGLGVSFRYNLYMLIYYCR